MQVRTRVLAASHHDKLNKNIKYVTDVGKTAGSFEREGKKITSPENRDLTNSMAYGTRRFNAAFTRAVQ